MKEIASFDVFDTVLTRAVGSPGSVFILLGRQLMNLSLISLTPQAFAHARIEAEKRAYKNFGVAKTTLKRIYSELGMSLGLSEEQCIRIMDLECELEADLFRVVPEAKRRILTARGEDQRIIFLSDMYLSCNFLQEQLAQRGLWDTCYHCYVSSELGKLKTSGELYREFLTREQVAPGLVSHFGNDLAADVNAATSIGLKTELFLDGNLNRWERILEDHAWRTEGLTSVMAGASRLARLNVPVSTAKQQALRNVAAGVIAPTLTGFVLWLLARTQQLGLKRLYFVARDGQILIDMARRLAAKLNVQCDLRYLYMSRQALNLYGMIENDEELSSWIWDNTPYLSVRSFLARISVDPKEIKELLESAGFYENNWSRNLDHEERLALRPLIQHPEFRAFIVHKIRNKQKVVLKYLKQEGLFEPVEWALVDLGWHGSLQNSLAVILEGLRLKPPLGFYFGLIKRPAQNRFGPREAYFFDSGLNRGFVKEATDGAFVRLEMFCSGDHGTVTGFTDDGDAVRPILKEQHNQAVIHWGLPVVRETVCHFVDNLFLDATLVNPHADIREAVMQLLDTFWASPSFDEAQAWGEFPWEDGFGDETSVNPSAKAYSTWDVLKTLRHGRVVLPHRASWHEASLVLTPRPIRAMLKGALRVRITLSALKQRVLRIAGLLS
jgi:FMN phosphatase YigB (HAD superfamily)